MFLSDLSIKRPVLTTMIMAALVVLGLFSVRGMGIDQWPKIDFPVVTVSVPYPGASPDAVEQDVVKKLEEAFNTLEKVKEISATSQESLGTVVVQFHLERDVDKALEDVRSKLGQIRRNLPETIEEPIIAKMDPAQLPVVSLVVSPDGAHRDMSPRELTRLAEEFLKRRVENTPGVGSVEVVGGSKREILVQADPKRLNALGISLQQLTGALGNDSRSIPSGNLLQGSREISVKVDAKARRVEDFEHMVVGNRQGRPVELREVATVVDGVKERRTLALLNGQEAVALLVQKQLGGNTVAMVDALDATLARLKPELDRAGVQVVKAKDNAKFIHEAVEDVKVSIFLGGALTVVIVFFFLRSWRSTLITSLTLPVSIISAFIIMKALDFTLNTMTLMGLSLAVGILIDDAIVVRENITRHAEMGKDHVTAAREGTAEIGAAVIATTLSILAVFVPVAFMGGIVGRFFFPFAITVAFAVLVSLFVSFTLDPMLSAVWPDPEHEKGHHTLDEAGSSRNPIRLAVAWFNRKLDGWEAVYRDGIRWALGHRKTVIAVGFGSFLLAMGLAGLLGNDFMSDADRGDLQVSFKTEPGASLAATAAKAVEVERILRQSPEVARTFTTIGTGLNATLNEGSIYVKFTEGRRRDHVALRREFRDRLRAVPGVETSIEAIADFGDSKPFQIAVLAPERALVEQAEPMVRAIFRKVTGAVDIQSSRDAGRPELRLVVDRKAASDLGVSPGAVAAVVRPLVDGVDVSKFEDASGEQYDVRVRLADGDRRGASDLAGMMVVSTKKDRAGNNTLVRVDQVARFEEGLAPSKLQRRDLQAQILLTANKEGKSLEEVVKELGAGIESLQASGELPQGVAVTFIGQARDNKETGGYMGSALLLAVVFIYIVLASQFESFKLPLTIMISLPLSMVGMVLMLLVTGDSMSMMTSIGLILLMGLVTKNAILLVDHALHLEREEGIPRREAIIRAGTVRLRPILMTSFAMIFGMLPLFFALGAGAEMRAPMARAVVGGIITSTLLTLIVVPVFFEVIDDLSFARFLAWSRRRLGLRTPEAPAECPTVEAPDA